MRDGSEKRVESIGLPLESVQHFVKHHGDSKGGLAIKRCQL